MLADVAVPALVDPSTLTPLDVNAFRISTSPLICADCNSERLISRLSMLPFVERITAGGCGWPAGGTEAAATGTIPKAASAGSEFTGSCTGIAALLIADAGEAWACCTWAEAADVGVAVAYPAVGLYVVAGVAGVWGTLP